jgi:hypothetical protein
LLVKTRTLLVNGARGLAKTFGKRLPKTSTEAVTVDLAAMLSPELQAVLKQLLKQIESVKRADPEMHEVIERIPREHYPEVQLLPSG